MDWKLLLEVQTVLDHRIEQEHPRLKDEDRLAKKVLALQVELGELANELPQLFKFWSNKKNNYKKALVEYVDCLHFILSIGLELGKTNPIIYKFKEDYEKENNILDSFLSVFEYSRELYLPGGDYGYTLSRFVELGQLLGFTWEQIEYAYLNKNKINHERQNNGY